MMEIKVASFVNDKLAQIQKLNRENVDYALEKHGREQAVLEGIPDIAEKIWIEAKDKENFYLLLREFKKQVFSNTSNIRLIGKYIYWDIFYPTCRLNFSG